MLESSDHHLQSLGEAMTVFFDLNFREDQSTINDEALGLRLNAWFKVHEHCPPDVLKTFVPELSPMQWVIYSLQNGSAMDVKMAKPVRLRYARFPGGSGK